MQKIMFKDRYGLTDAVLEGKKTMTRRIIPDIEIDWNRRGRVTLPVSGFEHGVLFMDVRSILHDAGICDYSAPAKYQPKYQVGEEVAIAQKYKDCWDIYQEQWEAKKDPFDWHTPDAILGDQVDRVKGWTNKMFVRADLMPYRILFTNIKAERLQDISEEDCLKEGIQEYFDGWCVHGIGMTIPKEKMPPIAQTADGKPYYGDRYRDFKFDSPREAFAALIDRISGKGTWNRNPWAFAYEFELIK